MTKKVDKKSNFMLWRSSKNFNSSPALHTSCTKSIKKQLPLFPIWIFRWWALINAVLIRLYVNTIFSCFFSLSVLTNIKFSSFAVFFMICVHTFRFLLSICLFVCFSEKFLRKKETIKLAAVKKTKDFHFAFWCAFQFIINCEEKKQKQILKTRVVDKSIQHKGGEIFWLLVLNKCWCLKVLMVWICLWL